MTPTPMCDTYSGVCIIPPTTIVRSEAPIQPRGNLPVTGVTNGDVLTSAGVVAVLVGAVLVRATRTRGRHSQ